MFRGPSCFESSDPSFLLGHDLGVQRLKTHLNPLVNQIRGESYTILFVSSTHIHFYFACHFFLVGGLFLSCAWIVCVPESQSLGLIRKADALGDEVNWNLGRFTLGKFVVPEFYERHVEYRCKAMYWRSDGWQVREFRSTYVNCKSAWIVTSYHRKCMSSAGQLSHSWSVRVSLASRVRTCGYLFLRLLRFALRSRICAVTWPMVRRHSYHRWAVIGSLAWVLIN